MVVTDYWIFFREDGFCQPIRGFLFQIGICNNPPIYCKTSRYIPHESEVMQKLAESLDENGGVEEDDGPWVALVVLDENPHQENVPWHGYHWRLCVSYQKWNQVNRQFVFPIP